jgi:predicted AlkP superfamily phosphohydrolase/phosphomutase
MAKQKVLLIGWDAADWNAINPLMDKGLMPALESLVNEGAMGNLATPGSTLISDIMDFNFNR